MTKENRFILFFTLLIIIGIAWHMHWKQGIRDACYSKQCPEESRPEYHARLGCICVTRPK